MLSTGLPFTQHCFYRTGRYDSTRWSRRQYCPGSQHVFPQCHGSNCKTLCHWLGHVGTLHCNYTVITMHHSSHSLHIFRQFSTDLLDNNNYLSGFDFPLNANITICYIMVRHLGTSDDSFAFRQDLQTYWRKKKLKSVRLFDTGRVLTVAFLRCVECASS